MRKNKLEMNETMLEQVNGGNRVETGSDTEFWHKIENVSFAGKDSITEVPSMVEGLYAKYGVATQINTYDKNQYALKNSDGIFEGMTQAEAQAYVLEQMNK